MSKVTTIQKLKSCGDKILMSDVYEKLAHAEKQVKDGKVKDGVDALKQLREKYDI